MARTKIVCNGVSFEDNAIKSCRIYLSNSIAFDELGIDTLDAEIYVPDGSGAFLKQFSYGKKVEFYKDDKIFQVFYISSMRRVSKYFYAISCISAVGLLDGMTHYGGLYTGQDFETVAKAIIGKTASFTASSDVKNIKVYGWLPVASCRDNLRQLLFASGVSLKKNNSGNISFELLDMGQKIQIPDSRIMLGGSVEYPAAASEAVVVEHSFFSTSSDETVTLYDGDVIADSLVSPNGVTRNGILVTFDQPVYGLSVSGASILESGVNYAVLSSGGYAVLTGKPYAHSTLEVKKEASSSGSNMSGETNIARVENATLVTSLNSEVIAERIANYYSSARTVREKILIDSERPGDYVSLSNPFYEEDNGIISSMDINVTTTLLSDTTVISGYTPPVGGVFKNVVRLLGVGVFYIPDGVTKIRAVLIGGGWGGNSGTTGKPGTATGSTNNVFIPEANDREIYLKTGTGGDGGLGGDGGQGGNILQITIDVTPKSSVAYSCGSGGSGGVSVKSRGESGYNSVAGAKGGNTTFGSYSSADGSPSPYGYFDVMSGNTYGGNGNAGIAGGKGGGLLDGVDLRQSQQAGPNVVYNGTSYKSGENNLEIISASDSYVLGGSYRQRYDAYGMYGAGGGAAAGANGNKSTDTPSAECHVGTPNMQKRGKATGGAGGTGADAVSPAKETRYGYGGTGGNGGGGQGGPGVAFLRTHLEYIDDPSTGIDPGTPDVLELVQNVTDGGGFGSNGGAGGDGCILIYY